MNARNDLHWKMHTCSKGMGTTSHLLFSNRRDSKLQSFHGLYCPNTVKWIHCQLASWAVIWKPQAAGWWMKYFLTDPCKLCRAGLALHRCCCSQHQCHHRYACRLLAPKQSIFAESKERRLCFQVCLWCSTVRWMNGTDISTKKKKQKKDRVGLFLQSKNHQSHTSARAQGEMHFCSYYVATVLIHVLPVQL